MSDAAVEAARKIVADLRMRPGYQDRWALCIEDQEWLVATIAAHTADLTAHLASARARATQAWEYAIGVARTADKLEAAVEQARQTVLDHEKGCIVIDPRCLRVIADALTSAAGGRRE